MINQLVSVIIPTYNNFSFIRRAINSVFNQTWKDFEIIVVDDGSTDRTRNIIQEFENNIVYLKQENKGPASARNRGLKIAKGKYVVFLDADDEFLPDKLSYQGNFLEENPSIDLVYSSGYRFRENRDGNQLLFRCKKQMRFSFPKQKMKILSQTYR